MEGASQDQQVLVGVDVSLVGEDVCLVEVEGLHVQRYKHNIVDG